MADAGQYAQILVALFSGIVWLSRDTLSAGHIRFFLKSPGDSQFFAALQASTPMSPFSEFTIEGALIECSLKEAEASETDANGLISARALTFAITHFANAPLGCVPLQQAPVGAGKMPASGSDSVITGSLRRSIAGALSRMKSRRGPVADPVRRRCS